MKPTIKQLLICSLMMGLFACNGSSHNAAQTGNSVETNMWDDRVQKTPLNLSDLINSGQTTHRVAVGQSIVVNPKEPRWRVTLGRNDRASAYLLVEGGVQRRFHFKSPGHYEVQIESVTTEPGAMPSAQRISLTFNVIGDE